MLLTQVLSIARRIWKRNLFIRLAITHVSPEDKPIGSILVLMTLSSSPCLATIMPKVKENNVGLLSCTPFLSTLLHVSKQEHL